MKKILICIFLLIASYSFAQKITILDKETTFPIYNVLVFNEAKTKQVVSNKNGEVNLSVFDANEQLIFSHISHYEFKGNKSTITRKRIVYLKNKTEQLEEVFLSASKGKESTKRIAEQVAIFSVGDIKKVAPQTSADVLSEISGIKVQKSQFGGGSPVLRGMEANRVLLVVDGVRMNNAIYRKGHLQNSITVSPNILERVEVIFGPSSVIYGSDALGGVIHYYTKKPTTSTKNLVNASLLSRFSTVNNEKTISGDVELQFRKFASLTNITHSKFGDLRMGKNRNHGFTDWGLVTEYSNNSSRFFNEEPVVNTNPSIQKNTGYYQTDFLQKFFVPITDKTNITFNLQYGKSSSIPRFDKLTERKDGELRFAEWYYGPQERLLVSSQLEIHPEKKWIKSGTITTAYQNIKESRINRKFGSLNRTTRLEKVDVFTINGDFNVPLTKDNDRILSYGIELNHNKVNSTPKGETLTVNSNQITGISDTYLVQSRYADGGSTYSSISSYVNYRQDISDQSTLNTGIRYTDTYLNAKWVDDTFITLPNSKIYLANTAFTATLGYVYKPAQNIQVNGVLSSGFRSPNIDDVGKVREKGGNVTVPNVDLRPEYAYNAEFGVLKYFKTNKSFVGITGYYTFLKSYIARQPFVLNGSSQILFDGELANTYANVNKGNARILGGTLNVKTVIGNYFITKGSITYTHGKTYDTKEPLSSIPPLFGNVSLNFEKNKLQAGIDVRFNGRKKVTNYNITEGIDNIEQTPVINPEGATEAEIYYGTPAWMTLNANAKYSVTKNIDLQVNIDNIFDEHYKEFASGVSAPGRNFSFSILANF